MDSLDLLLKQLRPQRRQINLVSSVLLGIEAKQRLRKVQNVALIFTCTTLIAALAASARNQLGMFFEIPFRHQFILQKFQGLYWQALIESIPWKNLLLVAVLASATLILRLIETFWLSKRIKSIKGDKTIVKLLPKLRRATTAAVIAGTSLTGLSAYAYFENQADPHNRSILQKVVNQHGEVEIKKDGNMYFLEPGSSLSDQRILAQIERQEIGQAFESKVLDFIYSFPESQRLAEQIHTGPAPETPDGNDQFEHIGTVTALSNSTITIREAYRYQYDSNNRAYKRAPSDRTLTYTFVADTTVFIGSKPGQLQSLKVGDLVEIQKVQFFRNNQMFEQKMFVAKLSYPIDAYLFDHNEDYVHPGYRLAPGVEETLTQ